MMEIVLGLYLATVAFLMWVLLCNNRTRIQRKRYIDLWPSGREFGSHVKAHESVTYYEHLWRLVTFRNPWKAYPAMTRRLMGEKSNAR